MGTLIMLGIFLLAGVTGIGFAVAWDRFVTHKGWKGWYFE